MSYLLVKFFSGLGDLISTLAPMIIELVRSYHEGRLEQLKEEFKNAQTPQEKSEARRKFAQRLYDK